MKLMKTMSMAGIACAFLSTAVQAEETKYLTMDAFAAGTTSGQLSIAMSQVVQKYTPVEIQVSLGKPGTKSAVDAAMGKVDLFTTSTTINHLMQSKAAMFAKVENAKELNAKLRNIVTFSVGPIQWVVYEDFGIKTMEDFRGKKVFVGPPASAVARLTTRIVENLTGMKAGEDYETPRYDWQSAETAFVDRQMDVFVSPTELPSAVIQQFGGTSKIRLIGVPESRLDALDDIASTPGRTIAAIPPNSYDNQTNEEPVYTINGWIGIGSHVGVDPDTIYTITKAFWEHIDEIHATAPWMKQITKEVAFKESNIPLHEGAYRYYKEAGFNVPEDLIPPETKD